MPSLLVSSRRNAGVLLLLLLAGFFAPRPLHGQAEIAPQIVVQSGLSYKPEGESSEYERARCKLDIYAPAGAKDLPCLVWFHGGGLTAGDKGGAKTVAVCKALAAEGLVVAAVNYRLSPKVHFPGYIDDAAAAIAWVQKNAASLRGNPQAVLVAGHSAGGYLAAMIAMDQRYLEKHGISPHQLAGVVPIAGQMVTHFTVREERGLPKTQIIVDEAAPIHFTAAKGVPPLLLLYAEKDMALRADENRYFAAALQEAGNRQFVLKEIAGHDHTGIGDRIAEPDSPVRKEIMAFVRRVLLERKERPQL